MLTQTRTKRRLSVPLTDHDERRLTLVRESPQALAALPGEVTPNSSEAAIIHALFEKGLDAMQEAQIDAAYAQMAEDMRSTRAARRARAVRVRRGNIDAE